MNTIKDVLKKLDMIIYDCKMKNSSLGYFPILYRKVTKRIDEGIENKEFEDNQRMELLDVLFAKRFIDAWDDYQATGTTTLSWRYAFEQEKSPLLVMQHILLGINAHINLDLGIAASETVNNVNLENLKNDFNTINEILGSMIDDFQDNINKVSPLFRLIDKIAGRFEEMLAQFSINIARKGAWKFCNEYANSKTKELTIANRDKKIEKISYKLCEPKGPVFNMLINFIRLFESKDPKKIMEILES